MDQVGDFVGKTLARLERHKRQMKPGGSNNPRLAPSNINKPFLTQSRKGAKKILRKRQHCAPLREKSSSCQVVNAWVEIYPPRRSDGCMEIPLSARE
jgi:hypothetical protein